MDKVGEELRFRLRDLNGGTTTVRGHGLVNEGRGYRKIGKNRGEWEWREPARAWCKCGAFSEKLHGKNARKRWHTSHKIQSLGGVP